MLAVTRGGGGRARRVVRMTTHASAANRRRGDMTAYGRCVCDGMTVWRRARLCFDITGAAATTLVGRVLSLA